MWIKHVIRIAVGMLVAYSVVFAANHRAERQQPQQPCPKATSKLLSDGYIHLQCADPS